MLEMGRKGGLMGKNVPRKKVEPAGG